MADYQLVCPRLAVDKIQRTGSLLQGGVFCCTYASPSPYSRLDMIQGNALLYIKLGSSFQLGGNEGRGLISHYCCYKRWSMVGQLLVFVSLLCYKNSHYCHTHQHTYRKEYCRLCTYTIPDDIDSYKYCLTTQNIKFSISLSLLCVVLFLDFQNLFGFSCGLLVFAWSD